MNNLQPAIEANAGKERQQRAVISILLLLATLAAFAPALRCGFVNYDDNVYVYENSAVTHGITLAGVRWAFSDTHTGNWHPLTWLSHMLDCQIYGLAPWGHHLSSIALHALSVVFLFTTLREATGALHRSAFAAALFALHPLRVESVVWIAERKDVLSGLFFMLTLWAYVRYARRRRRLSSYLPVITMFALGLLSKPTLVTLPFVLLLLDAWPLDRFKNGWFPLVVEKVPLLALAAAVSAATLLTQHGGIQSVHSLPIQERLGNAVVACSAYIGQMFYPAKLAVFYPLVHGGSSLRTIAAAFFVVSGVSLLAFVLRRAHPYFLTGWLWYLGMLVPMAGIIQVGMQSRADRYTYLPQIGLYIAAAWFGHAVCLRTGPRNTGRAFACMTLIAIFFCTRRQVFYWKDGESLWTHALACTPANFVAHNDLGNALVAKGHIREAVPQYEHAIAINPDYAEAHCNLGAALIEEGKTSLGVLELERAVQAQPDYGPAHYALGNALLAEARVDEAISEYRKDLETRSEYPETHNNLGSAWLRRGNVPEAIVQFRDALRVRPDFAKAHYNLGNSLQQQGDFAGAAAEYGVAIEIEPGYADAYNNLGNVFLRQGRLQDAIMRYRMALRLRPDYLDARKNLGLALALRPPDKMESK